ncbi:hypothetical protein E2C01_000808 [Portunus trituberculatus]|uniref:Uncharacterized protein n=1 Tax=Portunus trituberculatus TaxID=210409 RepID=A0A5B7CF50_PORTR|nr:hypothetical protein [Portunus trituberculatus]
METMSPARTLYNTTKPLIHMYLRTGRCSTLPVWMKGRGGREVELKRHKHKIITNDVPPTRTRDRNTPSLSSASANTYFIPLPISPILKL